MNSNGSHAAGADADTDAERVVDLSDVYGEASTGGARDGAHDTLPPAEAWETFEARLWSHGLAPVRQEMSERLHTLEVAIQDGRRPTAEEIRAARVAIERVEVLIERYETVAAGDS
jgi:hypothetical protein